MQIIDVTRNPTEECQQIVVTDFGRSPEMSTSQGNHWNLMLKSSKFGYKKERGLYELIEKLIHAAIPLWNVTLAPLTDKFFLHHLRTNCTKVKPIHLARFRTTSKGIKWDYLLRKVEWIQANRRLVYLTPEGEF